MKMSVAMLFFCMSFLNVLKADVPDRTILFIIDGLAAGAPERIPLENIQRLKKQGCYFNSVELPLPAHPKQSQQYPYSSSIPNPVMMTGTLFLRPQLKMLQEKFPNRKTAFITNSTAYDSIGFGYGTYTVLLPETDDNAVIERCKLIIEKDNPLFIRLHLQATGIAGASCRKEQNKSQPWYRNIWHPRSPYVQKAKRADQLLADLVQFLEDTGRLHKTVIFVTADHGQADTGWHPPYAKGSTTVPMLVLGTNVKKAKQFEYAEIIDIAPTIAAIHSLSAPDGAVGRVLTEILIGSQQTCPVKPQHIRRLNAILIEHHNLLQQKNLTQNPQFSSLNEKFLAIEKIAQWHNFYSDIESLNAHNQEILSALKQACAEPLKQQ